MKIAPILVFLAFLSLSFCWQTSLSENIRGISLIDDNKAIAYGDKTVYILDTGTGTFSSYDMVTSMNMQPKFNPDLNAIVTASNSSIIVYNTLKNLRLETQSKDQVVDICLEPQGAFLVLLKKGDEYSINSMKLELNNSMSLTNSMSYKTPVKGCRNVKGYAYPLVLTSNEIIIYREAAGTDTVSIPMKSVSSNIIYLEGKFYSASTGGLIASFDQNGRIFNTSSVPDNILAMAYGSTVDGIIAYGSSGKIYLFSKDLSLLNTTPVQKGVPLAIYQTSGGYAILMSSRLVLLDTGLNPIGDFAFDRIQENSVFARNQLLTIGGNIVESNLFSSGCSILSPEDYNEVGYLPFHITGKAFSYVSQFYIDVKINDEPWMRATGSKDWDIEVNPTLYPFGKMTLRCKTTEQQDARLSSVAYLDRVSTLTKNKFVVKAPAPMDSGNTYTIGVVDSFNTSVSYYNISINNENPKTISASKFSFSPSAPGDYTLKFSKDGFEDYTYVARVGGISILMLVIIIVLVLLVGAYLYFSYKK